MCLANAYLKKGSHEELIVKEVASLRTEGDELHLKSLFGEEKSIKGKIKEIDFINSHILLEQESTEEG
jgi:predicted RNA-binding protein